MRSKPDCFLWKLAVKHGIISSLYEIGENWKKKGEGNEDQNEIEGEERRGEIDIDDRCNELIKEME